MDLFFYDGTNGTHTTTMIYKIATFLIFNFSGKERKHLASVKGCGRCKGPFKPTHFVC
jgi:hypothetical protein